MSNYRVLLAPVAHFGYLELNEVENNTWESIENEWTSNDPFTRELALSQMACIDTRGIDSPLPVIESISTEVGCSELVDLDAIQLLGSGKKTTMVDGFQIKNVSILIEISTLLTGYQSAFLYSCHRLSLHMDGLWVHHGML